MMLQFGSKDQKVLWHWLQAQPVSIPRAAGSTTFVPLAPLEPEPGRHQLVFVPSGRRQGQRRHRYGKESASVTSSSS